MLGRNSHQTQPVVLVAKAPDPLSASPVNPVEGEVSHPGEGQRHLLGPLEELGLPTDVGGIDHDPGGIALGLEDPLQLQFELMA